MVTRDTVETGQMPTRSRLQWQSYFRHLASLMRLGHWQIDVSSMPPEEDHVMANVSPWECRHGALVRLSDTFLESSESEQRQTAVHELLHVMFAHSDGLAEMNMGEPMRLAWTHANEYAVDALACVLAESMPLPSQFFRTQAASKSPAPPAKVRTPRKPRRPTSPAQRKAR